MSWRTGKNAWIAAIAACAGLATAQLASAQINENFDSTATGSLPAGWTTAATGSGVPWTVVNTSSNSPANSVFTTDQSTASTATLTLPSITATATGPVTLDFWRRLDTEASSIATGFDGVRVQVSINGGGFVNLDNYAWLLNGYTVNSISSAGAVPHFASQFPAWTHSIGTVFATSGDTVQFQFVQSTDTSVGRGGVWLDDIVVTSAAGGTCCEPTGACTIRTAANCTSGSFTGGTSCTATPCPVIPNDTCSGAVPISLDAPVLGGNIGTNNTYQLTAASPPFTGLVQTSTTAPGRDSVFTFTPAASGNFSIRLTYGTISTMPYGTTQNMVLYIADVCPAGAAPITIPTANVLAASNRNTLTVNGSEEIHCVALTGGTPYWIYADQLALLAGSTFYLEVNTCTTETEPNDTPATANTYVFGNSGMEGSITPAAEVDFFSLGTPPSGSRVFALVDGNASSSNAVLIKVTTNTDTLEADTGNADGPFGASSSCVAGTPLTGLPSYLRISGSSTTTLYQPYRLYATVQAGTPVAETEPNETIAQANSDASNYFSGAISSSEDIDTFSFVAAPGALIFAALDCDPLRDNTPFNGALELLNSNGRVLAYVNDTATTSSLTTGAGSLTVTTPNSPSEALVWRVQTAGTYYIRVRTGAIQPNPFATQTAPTGDYLLSIALANNNVGPGACCASNGSCAVVSPTACGFPSLFQGVGSACNAGACSAATRACCSNSTGVCNFTTAASCPAGSTQIGSVCSPSPCPTAGACCATNGSCAATGATACASPSLFQGYGTACNAGACPTPVTACCNNSSGACTFVNGSACPTGSTANGSVSCATPCASTGVCCTTLGACSQIFGGSCPSGSTAGAGTTCSTNPCMAPPNVCENFDATTPGSLPANWTSATVAGTASTGGACQPSGWSVVNDQSHSSGNSVQASDPDRTFSQELTMPAVAAAGAVTLDLWARWQTESATSFFDGWTVESSINGSPFTNIQPTPADPSPWITGNYSGTISATFQSQISGQRAFVGISGGGATPAWVNLTAVIAANAGDVVQFKFRMVSDSSIGCSTNSPPYTGVWLDDICVYNIAVPPSGICCRGSTCTTSITSSAACAASITGGMAGANFRSGVACNANATANTPCCYADYNKANGITVQDIFDFLGDWFGNSPFANTGGTGAAGSLSVQNIFDFLTDWFSGGCTP